MKKASSRFFLRVSVLLLALAVGSASVPALATGAASTVTDPSAFSYVKQGKGIRITGYTGNDTVIAIPESIEGKTVTEIGQVAFYQCSATQIIIPPSVRRLGWSAFQDCANLRQVTLSEGLQTIDGYAFSGTALEEVDIPASVTKIGEGAFAFCGQLKTIRVEENNKKFVSEGSALLNRKMTELLWVSPTLTGHYDVPTTVKTIDSRAFRGSNLSEISLPATLSKIVSYAFEDCAALSALQIENQATGEGKSFATAEGVLYSKDRKTLVYYPQGKQDAEFRIPEGVTKIGGNAPELYNGYVTRVVVPDSLQAKKNFLSDCTNLEEVVLSDTNKRFVTVEGVLFTKDMKTLLLYPAKKADTRYTVPSSVKTVAMDAFRNADQLQSLTLSEGVRKVDMFAFANCSNLTEMILPNTLKSMGFWAFYGTPMRSTFRLTIPAGITKVDVDRFWYFTDTSNLILVCSEGSAAYRYAEENGIAHEEPSAT